MKNIDSLSRYIFRRAEHRDLSAILKLLREDELGKNRELSSETPARCYEEAFQKIDADPNHSLMVIELDQRTRPIIGTYHLTFLSLQGATRLQVESVRIAEDYRGEGIGTLMFEQIFKYAQEKRAEIVQLTTNKARKDAKRFYERLGFQATHEGMKLQL
jgi:GNAT superfamily N-acetyltransferase